MKKIMMYIVALSSVAATTFAQTKVKLDGRPLFLDVANQQQVVLYAQVTGNESSILEVSVPTMKNISVNAEIAVFQKSDEQTLKKAPFSKLLLLDTAQRSERNNVCAQLSPGESLEIIPDEVVPDPETIEEVDPRLCDPIVGPYLAQLTEEFKDKFSPLWTEGKVCSYILATNVNIPQLKKAKSTSTVIEGGRYTATLSKDACMPISTKYLVKVTVNLNKVPIEMRPKKLFVRLNEVRYSGIEASTIKPTSEGKFAPRPLILMSKLSGLCGSQHTVVKWQGNKIVSRTNIKVEDFIMYRDLILTRAPVDRVLRGGKVTFELNSPTEAYGVCFEAVAKRQSVNGYPIQ